MKRKVLSSFLSASYGVMAGLPIAKHNLRDRGKESRFGGKGEIDLDEMDALSDSVPSSPRGDLSPRSVKSPVTSASRDFGTGCNKMRSTVDKEPGEASIKQYDVTLWRLLKRRMVLAFGLLCAYLFFRRESVGLAVITFIFTLVFDFVVDLIFVKHCMRARHVELLEYIDINVLKSLMGDLPAWVRLEDVEKVEWINVALRRIWPFLNRSISDCLTARLRSIVDQLRIPGIGILGPECHLDFGTKAPIVTGVQVHDDDNNDVVLDLHVNWVSLESCIQLTAGNLTFSLTDIAIKGILRFRFGPLLPSMPIVGAVGLTFVKEPTIDFSVQAAGVECKPFISEWVKYFVSEQLSRFLVLPEEIRVPLSSELASRSHHPQGSLRVKLSKIRQLESSRTWVQAWKSVTSVTLRVGSQVLARNLKAWHRDGCIYFVDTDESDTFSFCVHAKHLQRLNLVMKDGIGLPVGEMNIDISKLEENVTKQIVSEPLVLSTGEEVEPPSVDLSVLYRPLHPVGSKTGIGGGVLVVSLREAVNLLPTDENGHCDSYFHFSLGRNNRAAGMSSSVVVDTPNPKWAPVEVFELFTEVDDEVLALHVYLASTPGRRNVFEDRLLATCCLSVPVNQHVKSHWFSMSRDAFDTPWLWRSPLSTSSLTPLLPRTPRVLLDLEYLAY